MELQALTRIRRTSKQLSILTDRGLFHPVWAFLFVVLSCTVFGLATCGLCFVDSLQTSVQTDDCEIHADGQSFHNSLTGDSKLSSKNTPNLLSFEGGCTNSHSFCFPSTLAGVSSKENTADFDASWCQLDGASHIESTQDGRMGSNKSWSSEYGMFELFGGGIIYCSINSEEAVTELSKIEKTDDTNQCDLSSCRGPFYNEKSSSFRPQKNYDNKSSSSGNDAISSSVYIGPTVLEWEQNFLYFPSVASLTVKNIGNDSVLHIYEPFSTDSQFYPCNSNEVSLGPGEVVSICFAFLPRLLGSSSAHLILQTSFGGFLIQAKGFAIQSPYGIQPSPDLEISTKGRWSKNLTLVNPFDETLFVEKVTAWISVSQGDNFHYMEAICSLESFQGFDEPELPSLKDGLVIKSSHMSQLMLSIRPSRHWNIGPHSNEAIIEIDFSVKPVGKVLGAVCMKLLRSSEDKSETVLIPIQFKDEEEASYNDVIRSFLVYLEPLMHHDNAIITIALKSNAPYISSFLKLIEVAESEVLQIKYMEGLLLFPGTITQVASVTCTQKLVEMVESSPEIFNVYKSCKLLILTNDSSSSQIEVPCHDIVHLCSIHWKDSTVGHGQPSEHIASGSKRTESLGIDVQSTADVKAGEGVEADEWMLGNWRSQRAVTGMSVIDERVVSFPVVELGSHCSRWINVTNPSEQPVITQLILNSLQIIEDCQDLDRLQAPSGGLVHNESTMPMKFGFSLAQSALTEAYVHPHSRASFGPIFFYPSNKCEWRTSALIRNNLSGVEWLSLRGFRGSLSLQLLEGSEPIQSIEFGINLPIPLNMSSSEVLLHKEDMAHACSQPLLKELHAKNTGDMPLEVKKIEISGRECGSDGFLIHDCRAFVLEPGMSKKLLISYQADFSATMVLSDLELDLDTGVLAIPIKATLPLSMLNACRKSVFWVLVKKWSLVVLLVSLAMVVLCFIFPSALHNLSSLDYFFKKENSSAAIPMKYVGYTFPLLNNRKNSNPSIYSRVNSVLKSVEKENTYMLSSDGQIEKHNHDLAILHEKLIVRNEKQSDELQKSDKERVLQSSLLTKSMLIENSDIPEGCNPNCLTVKTEKDRGRRRRKRKGNGARLTGLFEVSSSQSGNSTPSSPMSPLSFGTPKRNLPLSPTVDLPIEARNPFNMDVDAQSQKAPVLKPASKEDVLESKPSLKNCTKNMVFSTAELPLASRKAAGRPVLLPSATFPSAGKPAPSVLCSSSCASTPTIAADARAPGSKLFNHKNIEVEEKRGPQDEYTYDIWGDHFSGLHLISKSKDVPSMISRTVQNDSDSFFVRGPQTLISKSQPITVSSFHRQG